MAVVGWKRSVPPPLFSFWSAIHIPCLSHCKTSPLPTYMYFCQHTSQPKAFSGFGISNFSLEVKVWFYSTGRVSGIPQSKLVVGYVGPRPTIAQSKMAHTQNLNIPSKTINVRWLASLFLRSVVPSEVKSDDTMLFIAENYPQCNCFLSQSQCYPVLSVDLFSELDLDQWSKIEGHDDVCSQWQFIGNLHLMQVLLSMSATRWTLSYQL